MREATVPVHHVNVADSCRIPEPIHPITSASFLCSVNRDRIGKDQPFFDDPTWERGGPDPL